MSAWSPATKKALRISSGTCLVILVYVLSVLLNFFPHWPRSIVGWLVLLVIGVPLSMLLEAVGLFVLTERQGRAISPAAFSVKRLAICLLFFGLAFAALYGIWLVIGTRISEHFSGSVAESVGQNGTFQQQAGESVTRGDRRRRELEARSSSPPLACLLLECRTASGGKW